MAEIEPPTPEQIAAFAAAAAEFAAGEDAETVRRTTTAAVVAEATTLLTDFIAHAQLPVEDRDEAAAALLDTRAGTLMAQALGSTDPTVIGLTAKITALGLRLTRERADYNGGLL